MTDYPEDLLEAAKRISRQYPLCEDAKAALHAYIKKSPHREEWYPALIDHSIDALIWRCRGCANEVIKAATKLHAIPKHNPFDESVAEVYRDVVMYFELRICGTRLGSMTKDELLAARDECYARSAGYRQTGELCDAIAAKIRKTGTVEQCLTEKEIAKIVKKIQPGGDNAVDAERPCAANGHARGGVIPRERLRGRKSKGALQKSKLAKVG